MLSFRHRKKLEKIKNLRLKQLEDLHSDFVTCIHALSQPQYIEDLNRRTYVAKLNRRIIIAALFIFITLGILKSFSREIQSSPLWDICYKGWFLAALICISHALAKDFGRYYILSPCPSHTAWPAHSERAFQNALTFLDKNADSYRRWNEVLPDISLFKFMELEIAREIKLKKQQQTAVLIGIFGRKDKPSESTLTALNWNQHGVKSVMTKLIFDHAGLINQISDNKQKKSKSRS